jgi:hypothetical protein
MDAVDPVLRYDPVPTLASAHWSPDLLSTKSNAGPVADALADCGFVVAATVAVARRVAVDFDRNSRREFTLSPHAEPKFKRIREAISRLGAIIDDNMATCEINEESSHDLFGFGTSDVFLLGSVTFNLFHVVLG